MTYAGPRVRALREADWPAVRRIYADGLATGLATFETEVPSVTALQSKWIEGQRWVAELEGVVVGWAALTPVSERECYRGVAETSVYVAPAAGGRGVGATLVAHQVASAFRAGFWTLQAVVLAENLTSLALHRGAGFREVGRRERIAQRDGVWHDTVLMELRAP